MSAMGSRIKRVWSVFSDAWASRSRQKSPYSDTDHEFLPAHLELMEKPVSPAARGIIGLIAAIFLTTIVWSIVGQVEIVAVAKGKVISHGHTKVIESPDPVTVKRVLVQEGQHVRSGQVLIQFDDTKAVADAKSALDEWISARLSVARNKALANALARGLYPIMERTAGIPEDRLLLEQELASSQFSAYLAKRDYLRTVVAQKRAELAAMSVSQRALSETRMIARTREADYEKMLEGKYVGRHEYLLRKQERIAVERDAAMLQDQLEEARAALAGAIEQLDVQRTEFLESVLRSQDQAVRQVQIDAGELVKANKRLESMEIKSPIEGTVQQLKAHTINGFLQAAQPIMSIVPAEDATEVEALILNKDAGFVKVGQHAAIKVDAFPSARYGYLEGRVITISKDAVQDEKYGLVFPATIRLLNKSIRVDGHYRPLRAGMVVSVEVATGKRRVIDFVLGPLKTNLSEAGRER